VFQNQNVRNENSLSRQQVPNRRSSSADDWLSSLLTQTNAQNREGQLSQSLQTLRHEMGQIAASLNLQDQKPQFSVNKDPASILADIERRQNEILNGLKKPHYTPSISPYFEEKTYEAPPTRQDKSQDHLTTLSEILADVIPEKTVSALRREWQTHSENLLNRPIERLSDMEAEIRAVSLKINRLSERELSVADAHKLNEMLSLLKQNNAQNLHSFQQLEQSLSRLVQHLEKPVQENNDILRLENKFEQLATHILRDSKDGQLNTLSANSVSEKALVLLLQKLEVTDRKIDHLMRKNGDAPLIKTEEEPQKEAIQPVIKQATERLNTRFNLPQTQKSEVDEVRVNPPHSFSTPLDTGNVPFDMPLEPGRGAARFTVAKQRENYFTTENFEENTPVKQQKEPFLTKSLVKHRRKLIMALSAILILIGSMKAATYLLEADKRPLEKVITSLVTPSKKIETTSLLNTEPTVAPRAVESRKIESRKIETPLFAPESKVEVIAPPAVKIAPGVALNDGWQAVNAGDKSDPLAALKTLAANNNPSAQFELANRLYEKTPAESLILYQQAADQNFAPAQFRLGSLYEKGIGVSKDQEKARKLYLSAASLGHAKSMHNLAVLNADNSEGKADLRASAQWFRRAAEHGIADSQFNLAVLHARGMGVEQSLTESYKWFALAALGGDRDAASKRDDLEKRLSPETLSAAKMAVETFKPRIEPVAANKIDLPAEITGKNNLLTRPITGKQI
jgi:TPR repeat protein